MNQKQRVPNILKAQRKAAGLRQLDVARLLRLACTNRISRWEKGKAVPHLENLLKLSVLYKTAPHELYGELLKTIEDQLAGRPGEGPLPEDMPCRSV